MGFGPLPALPRLMPPSPSSSRPSNRSTPSSSLDTGEQSIAKCESNPDTRLNRVASYALRALREKH
jgi:hypothetical protein